MAPLDGPQGPPTDHVIAMQQQGLSNNQIVEYLQRQGYDPDKIFEAMNQASVKGSVENGEQDYFSQQNMAPPGVQGANNGEKGGNMNPPEQYAPQEPMQEPVQPVHEAPQHMPPPSSGFSPSPSSSPSMSGGVTEDQIERIAETIIEEKWNEISKQISRVIDWKEKTEEKIGRIEQEFEDLKKGFDSLHDAILGKVGEYDKNIVNIGVELKAMEKVFQKILPTLTDNVSELSKIAQDLKK